MSTLAELRGEPDVAPPCAADKHSHPATDKQGRPTGHKLCARHFIELAKDLRTIESEARDLDARPSMGSNLDGRGGGKGAPAFQRAPARLDPIVLADHRHGEGWFEEGDDEQAAGDLAPVLVVLNRYANRVRAGRDIEIPLRWVLDLIPGREWPTDRAVCPRPCTHKECLAVAWWKSAPLVPTIHSERDLLTRQLDWICTQDWVTSFYRDMRKLRGQLQQANGTSAPRPIPGKCPVQMSPGRECGGPLWPTKPKHTVGEWTGSSPSAIKCGSCNERWEGAGPIARLALVLEAQRKEAS